MHSACDDPYGPGCPIRKSRDPSLFTGSLWLIAGYHVLHRLLTPRHPPCALPGSTVPTGRRDSPAVGIARGSQIQPDRNEIPISPDHHPKAAPTPATNARDTRIYCSIDQDGRRAAEATGRRVRCEDPTSIEHPLVTIRLSKSQNLAESLRSILIGPVSRPGLPTPNGVSAV
jgi:hypothetical protein